MALSSKHRATLAAVFERPTRGNLRWADIEALFEATGADVTEGAGSRVRIKLNDRVRTFHRPHPGKETRKYAVEAARDFLRSVGMAPDTAE